jgi:hypothetical protein
VLLSCGVHGFRAKNPYVIGHSGFGTFDPDLVAINLTIHALSNLDTLYVDCDNGLIRLVGYQNGKATYTTTIKVSE